MFFLCRCLLKLPACLLINYAGLPLVESGFNTQHQQPAHFQPAIDPQNYQGNNQQAPWAFWLYSRTGLLIYTPRCTRRPGVLKARPLLARPVYSLSPETATPSSCGMPIFLVLVTWFSLLAAGCLCCCSAAAVSLLLLISLLSNKNRAHQQNKTHSLP